MANCEHQPRPRSKKAGRPDIVTALAGNANVGKSTLFNQLTGLHQHVGNWPGKTVERKEGTLQYSGYKIDVVDLPGIYSLSTFSIEELISREYIVFERPDVVVNVIDASLLERNLFFTFQLMELQVPMVIALNMVDLAEKRGIKVDERRLSEILGIPVVKMVASKGIGIKELMDTIVDVATGRLRIKPKTISYGKDVEERIERIVGMMDDDMPYLKRFVAIKLLEGDGDVKRIVRKEASELASRLADELAEARGYPAPIVIASERYAVASKIAKEVQEVSDTKVLSPAERIDMLLTHRIFGYPIMLGMLLSLFYVVFTVGSALSDVLSSTLEWIAIPLSTVLHPLLLEGVWGGFIAGLTLLLPFVIPFYILLTAFEDSGYLPRVAFMLDNLMHKVGLHGKAIIPILMGYGCNVPACYACRIMGTERERLITAFVVTFIPCTARLIVIYGLVASYVGIQWAYMLLLLNFGIALAMGKLAYKACPGESVGLIMEMPPFRKPSLKVVAMETLVRIKSIVYLVFPIYMVGGAVVAALQLYGILKPLEDIFGQLMEGWLGLPPFTVTLLIFGFIRKELILILPAVQFGTMDLSTIFSPIQMVTLAFIAMLYAPCAATFAMLRREFGLRVAIYITLVQLGLAILAGGILYKALIPFL